jgi:hypothetical protein
VLCTHTTAHLSAAALQYATLNHCSRSATDKRRLQCVTSDGKHACAQKCVSGEVASMHAHRSVSPAMASMCTEVGLQAMGFIFHEPLIPTHGAAHASFSYPHHTSSVRACFTATTRNSFCRAPWGGQPPHSARPIGTLSLCILEGPQAVSHAVSRWVQRLLERE